MALEVGMVWYITVINFTYQIGEEEKSGVEL